MSSQTASNLALHVLGPLRVLRAERPVPGIRGERVRDLVGYLALRRGQPQPRERLAEEVWGDNLDGDPRKVLRQTLWRVNTACVVGGERRDEDRYQTHDDDDDATSPRPIALVRVDEATVQLSDDPALWLDVAAFEARLAPTAATPGFALEPDQAAQLAQAVELYGGDFLDGCYRDWCFPERERLRQKFLGALEKLLAYAETQGDRSAGLDLAGRILQADPTHEPTHRAVMRLHLLGGDRAAALRQFDACVAALSTAYSLTPDPRTAALAQLARGGDATDAMGSDVA